MLRKAIIVSPSDYYQFFVEMFPEWDIQPPVDAVSDLWEGLESGRLDDTSDIVILNDVYYSDQGDELEEAIITLAGAACVLVIADEEYKEAITAKVSYLLERNYGSIPNFWFISRDNPIVEVNEAVAEYDSAQQAPVGAPPAPTAAETLTPGNTSNRASNAPQEASGLVERPEGNAYDKNPYLEPQQDTQAAGGGYSDKAADHAQYVENFKSADFSGDGYTGVERNGMVIASTSSKGGSGKSTVAISTASMLYHASRLAFEAGDSPRPLDVVLVDMDTRDGQIGFLLSESHPTVLNIFASQDFSRNNIKENLVHSDRLGFDALLAPKRARTADYTTPEFYREIITKLRTMFDIVVLDTSVNYSDPLIYDVVLPISDAVLLVTEMSRGSVFGMTRWITEVTLPLDKGGSAAISKDKIGVVVNKSLGNVGFDQNNLVEAAAEVPLIASIPMDSAGVLAASNNDRLDDVVLKHPEISPAYFALVQKIVQGSVPLKSPYETLVNPPESKKDVKLPPKKGLFGRRK